MGTKTKSLYETDFADWSARTAELLRVGRLGEVDLERVAEEIEDLGKSERKSVRSQLRRMLLHMMKQELQPERDGASWQVSIAESRMEILDDLEESPSLLPYLEENLEKIYGQAVAIAMKETSVPAAFRVPCPCELDALLNPKTAGIRFTMPVPVVRKP